MDLHFETRYIASALLVPNYIVAIFISYILPYFRRDLIYRLGHKVVCKGFKNESDAYFESRFCSRRCRCCDNYHFNLSSPCVTIKIYTP